MSQPLVKCKRVFQALINIAIEELCETADALIAPVRMGVARPTALFSLVNANVEAIQVSGSDWTGAISNFYDLKKKNKKKVQLLSYDKTESDCVPYTAIIKRG